MAAQFATGMARSLRKRAGELTMSHTTPSALHRQHCQAYHIEPTTHARPTSCCSSRPAPLISETAHLQASCHSPHKTYGSSITSSRRWTQTGMPWARRAVTLWGAIRGFGSKSRTISCACVGSTCDMSAMPAMVRVCSMTHEDLCSPW